MLAFNNLLKLVEFREHGEETIFNLGLFLSFASLFFFPFWIFLLCAVIILALFTRCDFRRHLLVVFAFLLPHLFLFSTYYFFDEHEALWRYFYRANFQLNWSNLAFKGMWGMGSIPLFYLILSLLFLSREARFTRYQGQLIQVMFLWLFFSLLFILQIDQLRNQHLLIFIPGISFLITHFLLVIRRKKFAELNFWILFIGIVSIHYLMLTGYIDPGRKNTEFVNVSQNSEFQGKKILVLDDNLEAYQKNTLGSPFLDWKLSKAIFMDPRSYENVLKVYDGIKADPPEIIFDPYHYMSPFLLHFSDEDLQYEKKGDLFIKLTKSGN